MSPEDYRVVENFKQFLDAPDLNHIWKQVALFHAGRYFTNLKRKLRDNGN